MQSWRWSQSCGVVDPQAWRKLRPRSSTDRLHSSTANLRRQVYLPPMRPACGRGGEHTHTLLVVRCIRDQGSEGGQPSEALHMHITRTPCDTSFFLTPIFSVLLFLLSCAPHTHSLASATQTRSTLDKRRHTLPRLAHQPLTPSMPVVVHIGTACLAVACVLLVVVSCACT